MLNYWNGRAIRAHLSARIRQRFDVSGDEMRAISLFLVEDEALIRMMMVQMVEELGHRVIAEAGSVREALSLAETSEFDLALLDVNLDGESVAPVARAIERRGLPFLFVTGYAPAALPEPFTGSSALRKPFPIEVLKQAIGNRLKT
jgi:CheY-like chemotaxis protein